MLEPFEQFYQGVLFLFERIRGAASDEVEARLTDLASMEPVERSGPGDSQERSRLYGGACKRPVR